MLVVYVLVLVCVSPKLSSKMISFGTHGHGQQCGDCWGERDVRELNGNRKIQ